MSERVVDPAAATSEESHATLQRIVPPPQPTCALLAVVVEGPDAGREFRLDPASPLRALLGTSRACDIRLGDAAVSRRHLAFEPEGGRFRVTDLGSRNGTAVDGVSIREAFLRGGELLRLGSTAIRIEAEPEASTPALLTTFGFRRLVGCSVVMRRLYPLCVRLAASDVPVVIEGETGTGKELLAECLHEASGKTGPFAVLDCSSLSPAMADEELFGSGERPGAFERAHGGTLLIDEIADLDATTQPKLLRVLERREVRRLGAGETRQLDFRVLTATRRDLDKEVSAGRFRDDLYHRIAVARVELPPLRARHGDVGVLTKHFAQQMGCPDLVTPDLLARFADEPWPGNVRELKNALARAAALGDLVVGAGQPPQRSADAGWADAILASGAPLPIARKRLMAEFERRYVEGVLAEHQGNVSRAAAASGIAIRYFQLVKARAASEK